MTHFESFAHGARTVMAVLAVILFTPSEAASQTVIREGVFKYDGHRYFRSKAENVRLGSYGEKQTPIGQPNYLLVDKNIRSEHFEGSTVRSAPPVDIDWERVTEAEIQAGGSVKYIKADGKATLTRSTARQANLKLVKFWVNKGALKDILNRDADGARKYLAREGRDARVVGEVWVVMEAELAEKVNTGGSLSAKSSAGGLDVSVGGSGSTTTTITLASDTTFAYLLYKPKWTNRDRNKIEDLEDDRAGLN